MPLFYERTFRVRYSECDVLGHVNNTNYLRYMQETAFDASAAAGYGMDIYSKINRVWLARQTEIEYLRPLCYGDSVIVRTWVADFRRVTSRREYEMRLSTTGEPVARGYTEWAFVDSKTARPAAIPPEAVSAFFPEGRAPDAPPRERIPAPPPPPAGAYTMRRQVAWHEIDTARFVNNPIYLTYAEDCGFNAIAACHWPVARMLDTGGAIVAHKNQVEYLAPAMLGDELEVVTWLSDVRRASAMRHYTISRAGDGTLLARVHTYSAWLNRVTGRAAPFPAEMLDDFAPQIVA
jgi:acyl-CoA thioester hydrolase